MGFGLRWVGFQVNRFGEQRQPGAGSAASELEPANKNTLHENKHRARLSELPSLSIIFPRIWTYFFFLITSVVPSLSQDRRAERTASM